MRRRRYPTHVAFDRLIHRDIAIPSCLYYTSSSSSCMCTCAKKKMLTRVQYVYILSWIYYTKSILRNDIKGRVFRERPYHNAVAPKSNAAGMARRKYMDVGITSTSLFFFFFSSTAALPPPPLTRLVLSVVGNPLVATVVGP